MQRPPPMDTNPLAGVTATSPATTPEANPSAVDFPLCIHSTSIHARPAAAAADCVAAKAAPARGELLVALPPLNPNHPTHNRPAPRRVSTMLFGWAIIFG